MHNQIHAKSVLQIASAILICFSLLIPSVAQAQTPVPPPPPPLEKRREMATAAMQNLQSDTSLQPRAVQTVLYPATRMAFQSYKDGNWEIYTANDDGSNQMRLTNNAAADIQPSLNRGATRVAFVSKRDGNYEIYSINVNASGLTRLTNNKVDDVYPAWSPDSQKIAFQSYRDGQPEIYVMNADGTQPTRLTNNSGYDGQPAWSLDGTKIIYVSGASYNLYIMNADGSNSHALSSSPVSADPTWSPDGVQIAFDADNNLDGYQELMIYDTHTGATRQVLDNSSDCDIWAGGWSPDGRYLAYTQICYIYYRGNWYWTDAYVGIWDSTGWWSPGLVFGNTIWNPDWQSTDAVTPTSYMQPLPSISASMIWLQWGGADVGGSGLKSFDVQYKDGVNDSWRVLYKDVVDTAQVMYGTSGHTYYFRVRARSNALNVGPWPADYDTMTTVDSVPPIVTISPLPKFSKNSLLVRWSGYDPGGFGVSAYQLQYKETTQTTWIENYLGPQETSQYLGGAAGYKYCVRMNATDTSNNVSPFTDITEDKCSTIYSWQLSGVVHDNAGAPVESAQVTLNPTPINTPESDSAGNYFAYGDHGLSFYNVNWSKSGYGSLTTTTVSSLNDATLDVTLPPADDIIQNGSFETGSLAPETWQTSGTLPVTAASSAFHTGQFGAQMGDFLQGVWDDPEKIDEYPANYGLGASVAPRLVIDSLGTSHAVWINGNDLASARVEYASKAVGDAWSTPEVLSDIGLTGTADIAVDEAGTLYVAWSGSGVIYRSKPKGGDWSKAVVAMSGTYARVRIGADPSGVVHVLGSDMFGLNPGVSYTTSSGGVWSAPYVIDPLGWNANMMVDSTGTVHILWEHDKTYEIALYASRSKDGDWSPTTQASSGFSSYFSDLFVDNVGTVYVVWIGNDSVNYRVKQPGSDWGATETIASDVSVGHPGVRIFNGRIGVSYTEQYGLYFTERGRDGGWSTPILVTSYRAMDPDLAFGQDGRFSLIWSEDVTTSGQNEKIMFREEKGEALTGDAVLSQSVAIPESLSSPTLAFYYHLQTGSLSDDAGLKAILQTATGEVVLLSTQINTNGWVFQTFDVSKWSGQTVTLEFRLHKAALGLPTWAQIDDVTLGSAHADAWVSTTGASGRPGDIVTFNIFYGNYGGAAAKHAGLSLTLPAGLTLVSAEPAPSDPAAATLTWDLGDLASKGAATTIQLKVQIDPSVTIPHDLTSTLTISSDTPELETANNQAQIVAKVPYYFTYLPTLFK